MRRSFSDSHIRIEEGGWTRQTTVRELPASKEIAGVNMRLEPGVIRELHFDSGDFSEDSTFLLNEWIEHTPKAVVAENFRLPPEIFENIHEKDKYIFQGMLGVALVAKNVELT